MINKLEKIRWIVYLIRCKNGSLYTGITNNLERRFAMHIAGTGAKFLRGKGPLSIEFATECFDKSHALRVEYRIKQLPRAEKEKIISGKRNIPQID